LEELKDKRHQEVIEKRISQGNLLEEKGSASYGLADPFLNGNLVWVLLERTLTNKGTYLSVPMHTEFKSILTYRDLDEYLKYEYLSCPRSGMENK
jgi:hypothetical protein